MTEQLKTPEIKTHLPETTGEYRDFFRRKALEEQEVFRGYDGSADLLASAIEKAVLASKKDLETMIDVPLVPGRIASAGLYESEMSDAPAALVELALQMTHAELKYDADSQTGHKYLWQGRYDGVPINFLETVSDEENRNSRLVIGTVIPEGMTHQQRELPQTPAEKRIMYREVMSELEALPTIDEPTHKSLTP